MKLAVTGLMLIICMPIWAKEQQHEWYYGTVVNQQMTANYRGTYSTANVNIYPNAANGRAMSIPIYARQNTVVVDSFGHRLVWQEKGRRAVVFTIGGSVRFYQDGNYFVVLDANGKKHKFVMMSDTLLPKAQAGPASAEDTPKCPTGLQWVPTNYGGYCGAPKAQSQDGSTQ